MEKNKIIKVVIDEQGRLLVFPMNTDNPTYEYIYRAAKGVYWDKDNLCFSMNNCVNWTFTKSFKNIIDAVYCELGITFILASDLKWQNVELEIQLGIQSLFNAANHKKLQNQDYIQVSRQNDHVVIAINDHELFDLIDDLLTQLDLDIDYLTKDETGAREKYCMHLQKNISLDLVINIINTIDPKVIEQIWLLNNHPIDLDKMN